MAQTPDTQAVAIAFVIFWVVTFSRSVDSANYFILRSIVVLAYTLFSAHHPSKGESMIEMVAEFMVWFHWIGLFQVLLYPDARFPKRIKR